MRQAVIGQLTASVERAEDAEPRIALLAALTLPAQAIDALIDKPRRQAARRRAEALIENHRALTAVGEAASSSVAAAAAVTMASVASSSGCSGSSGSGV